MILLLLAETAPPARPKLTHGELLWAALPLIGALLVGAFVIYLFDRWRKRRAARNDVCDPNDQLSHFRSLYERGEMSREEFDQVRALLAAQLRQEVRLPERRPTVPTTVPAETAPAETNVQTDPPAPQSLPPSTEPPP